MTIIPSTYEEWEQCITVECGIPLSEAFVSERIEALENDRDYHTQKFVKQWGEAHRVQTLAWFREAKAKLAS